MLVEVALVGLCAVFAGGLWAIWARMGRLDARIDSLDGRFAGLDTRIDDLDTRLSKRIILLSERVARIEGMLTALLPSPEPSPH